MEILAGQVRNYYKNINVASIEVTDSLKVGDLIHIKGHFTDFDQEIYSIEIGHTQVKEAAKGQIAGIKVDDYVRKNDFIYKIGR
jgi:putative protease